MSWCCRFAVLPALFVLLAASGVRAEERSAVKWLEDSGEAWTAARAQSKPLLLYFSMEQCVYCRKMESETLADASVAAKVNQRFVPVSVKAEDNRALVQKLHVQSFPTTVVISPNGTVEAYVSGYVNSREFQTRLSDALGESDRTGGRLLIGRRLRSGTASR